jgi:hypothetical protein
MIRAYQNDRLRRRALARHHVDVRLWLSRIPLIELDADHLRIVRQMIPLHLSFPLEHVICLGLLRDRDRAGSGQRETQIRPPRRYLHTQAGREHVADLRLKASSSVYFAGGCPRSKNSSRSSRCACAERCGTRWHCRLCADCRARTACPHRPRGSAAPAERRPSGSGPHLEYQCGAGHS